MEWLSQACDIVILIAAVLGAIAGIYTFFRNSGKGIKKKVDESNAEKEKELQEKIDARAKAVVQPMLEQQAATLTKSFGALLDQHLPTRLVEHDKETRQKYLGDRLNYLNEIKNEVVQEMQDKLDAVETHENRMEIFTQVLKELLRERIMVIYGRNKARRELEEHEKVELDRAYPLYKSLNGNSYIDDYYARMQTWKIIPDDKQ